MVIQAEDHEELAAYEAWQSFYGYPSVWLPALVGSHRAVTFPTTGLGTKCRIALAANLSQDWRSWNWLDISDRVRWQDGVTVTTGKRDRDPNVPASTANFTITNIDGELSRQNVFSTLYGSLFKHNPIWLTVDAGNGEFDEFFGFTQELPKRSDKSGTDGRIHMTCKGPLDHIFRTKEIESPLRTACIAAFPTHLWTLEEESTAGQASSALVGGTAMTQSGTIDWAGSSSVVGAKPLPNMRSGSGTLIGALDQGIAGGAPGYAFDHNYIVSIVTSPEDFASGSFNVFHITTENQNSIQSWDLNVVNDGTVQLISNDYSAVPTVRATSAVIAGIFTEPKLLTFTGELLNDGVNAAAGVAGDAVFRILVNNVEVATSGTLNQYTGNLMVGTLTATNASEAAPLGMFMAHHLDYFDNGAYTSNVSTVPNGAQIVDALDGHTGEMVHERIRRICQQKGISFYTSAGVSQTLGPQPIDTPINVIRNAELVEGVVYEKEFGLAYKSQAEYYRQPVSLALDIAAGHIVGELVPADDTMKFFNQWTITRQGGSSSTQQKDGGISENEETFSNQATLNVETDVQTAYAASYRANRDSSEADRWPYVQFYLQKNPELITTYQGMPFGARVTVANMKTRWGVVSLDLTVEGKTVFFNSKKYEVTLNASDATIHNIGMLDGGQALDSRSMFLNADISTSATSLELLLTNPSERFSTDAADYPVDVVILGEQVTLTAVPTEVGFDAFGRTEVDTWGTSDSGLTIVSLGGAATDYDVNGGTGKHLLTSVNVMRHSVYSLGSGIPADSYNNIEFYADVKITVTPTGGAFSCWLTHRFQDVNNYYDAILLFHDTVTTSLTVGARAGGLHSLLTNVNGNGLLPLGVFTVGNFWRIQIRVMENLVSAKAWEVATQTEPSEYMVSGTANSTTGVHPLGSDFAVQSRLEPGNTNVNPTVEWDNVHVINPSRFTVVRSVNGVERAHPKGRQVRAYDPFILGL